jgi:L-threonylcarbamoyladenylate synthase
MKILPFNDATYPTLLPEMVAVLKSGGVIIFPTETCYGLGVDATNEQAVQRLLDYKGGRGNKPVSVAVSSKAMAKEYVELNSTAETLYSTLLPGPVTVISMNKGKVARQLVSDMNTLGVRIPNYPLLLRLITDYGKPITATSANPSGGKPPYSIDELNRYTSKNKLELIDLFLDAGRLPIRPPSTVVDTTLNEPTVLRQGDITLPEAAQAFGSSSVDETRLLGEEIMRSFMDKLSDSAIIFAMQGELGAGKTQLSKGVAKALGIDEMVNSPTYTIVKEYEMQRANTRIRPYKNQMFHIDTWRLHEGEELWDLGLKKMLKPGNVVVIEWLQKVKPMLERLQTKAVVVWVEIEVTGEETRQIKVWHE